MTKQEFDEELEHTNQHLVAHIDALTKSNAQCAEYLRKTEQMQAEHERLLRVCNDYEDAAADIHRELVSVRAALAAVSAERDSLKRTLLEWEDAETEPHVRVAADDIADHVVPPVLPICTTCHGCGSVLYPSPAGDYFGCGDVRCTRSNTKHWHPGCTIGPYAGPCKSTTPVRHE